MKICKIAAGKRRNTPSLVENIARNDFESNRLGYGNNGRARRGEVVQNSQKKISVVLNARLCSVMMKWALLPWNQSNGNANLLRFNEIESNERDTITVWDGANVCAAWCTANSYSSSSHIHTSPEAHIHSAWTLSKYTHADNLSYSKLIFRTIRFDSISIANWNRIECAVHTWRFDFNFEPATLLAMAYWPVLSHKLTGCNAFA